MTGDLTISSSTPIINLTDTNNDSDYQIKNGNGDFNIKDVTNGANRISINSSGTVTIAQHMDVGAGLDVTGDITGTGDLTLTGSDKKFISTSSSSGDYIRLYAGSGTGKWDIYGNGANLRFSDNDSAGKVVIDTELQSANFTITSANPSVTFAENDQDPDFGILCNGGQFRLQDLTNTANLFTASSTTLRSVKHHDFDAGIDVTGAITATTNITANGNIVSSGNLQISNDTGKLLLGSSNDLQIYHNGTNSYIDNNTGALVIDVEGNTQFETDNFYVLTNDNENAIRAFANGSVELYHDNSKKFQTHPDGAEVVGHLLMGDNKEIKLGDSSDLKLYHDGSNSFISETGTGVLVITGSAGVYIKKHDNVETMAAFLHDSAVELYYNNVKKLATTANGIKLNDNTRIGLGDGEDLQILHDGSRSSINNRTGELRVLANHNIRLGYAAASNTTSATENYAIFNYNGSNELYFDNSKKLETTSYGNLSAGQVRVASSNATTVGFSLGDVGTGFYNSGSNAIGYSANGTQKWNINSSGDLRLVDNVKANFGTGDDMELVSDGSTSFIRADDLRIRIKNNLENYITCEKDAAVKLFFGNSKKVETTSSGATVTGDLILTGTGTATSNALDLQYNHTSGLAQINADSSGGSTSLSFGTSDSGTLATAMTINSDKK